MLFRSRSYSRGENPFTRRSALFPHRSLPTYSRCSTSRSSIILAQMEESRCVIRLGDTTRLIVTDVGQRTMRSRPMNSIDARWKYYASNESIHLSLSLTGLCAHRSRFIKGASSKSLRRLWQRGVPRCSARRYLDRKSTRLNSSHSGESRMPSSA